MARDDEIYDSEFDFLAGWGAQQNRIHQIAVEKGWWEGERNIGELLALVHSEVSEALEAFRHGNPPSEHIPEFTGAEEECADVIIRIMDFAAAYDLRVAEALLAKVAFNVTRSRKHGGKVF